MDGEVLIKSRERVIDHGEVFTPSHIVEAMLDLVKNETERIDSRFLEPACGDGNFLAPILERKLAVVMRRYGKNTKKRADFEFWSLVALMSIYGVDLLPDNVAKCRERLFTIWNTDYTANNKKAATNKCRDVATFILSRNIQCGDALSLKTESGEPIAFSQWGLGIKPRQIKREDFTFAKLLEPKEVIPDAMPSEPKSYLKQTTKPNTQANLFEDAPPEETDGHRVAEYEPVLYLDIVDQRPSWFE